MFAAAPKRAKLSVHVVSEKFKDEYASNPMGIEAPEPEVEPEPETEAEAEAEAETGAAAAETTEIDEGYTPIASTVIPEAGYAAWKSGMAVHAATRLQDDGLAARDYSAAKMEGVPKYTSG